MKSIVGFALVGMALSGAATAKGYAASLPLATRIPDSDVAAAIPNGWVAFCLRDAGACRIPAHSAHTAPLTRARWTLFNRVNRAINTAITPQDDQAHYGVADYWTVPTDGHGDCEDYALAKRKALIAAGLPVAALRLAVVRTDTQERHAILTVATDRGDFVLDNLNDAVRPWTAFQYVWLERQDPRRRWGWERLNAGGSAGGATSRTR